VRRSGVVGVALSVVLAISLMGAPGSGAAAAPSLPPLVVEDEQPGSTVPHSQRDRVLAESWRSSTDLAWATSGDAAGFHLLVAEARTGYTWRTAATLVEPGFPAGQWVGNACLTGSGHRAVVVYAPREFTNHAELFDRGAFAAVVDLRTGTVVKLPVQSTLAYYNPGCGAGETATLTQLGGTELGSTRIATVNALTGRVSTPLTIAGQVTSAVPASGGYVASLGHRLVQIGPDGAVRTLAKAQSAPFRLHPDATGGVAFQDWHGSTVRVRYTRGREVRTVATGALGEVRVTAGSGGQLFLTGERESVSGLPPEIRQLDVPADVTVSSRGELAVTRAAAWSLWKHPAGPFAPVEPGLAEPASIEAVVPDTGARLEFTVQPAAGTGRGGTASPAVRDPGGGAAFGSPTDPVEGEDERECSVPRNDPHTQVYQPTPQQVEWAVNLAVDGGLTFTRPADWKGSGLPAWSPQGMFPPIGLTGGGRVPEQIMLGILAQESNLWQATWHAVPGVTANPLIGNYYGRQIYDDTEENDWEIHWDEADCGYGVGQVTDGMELRDTQRTPTEQRAIAIDYATNIAAALRILESKWNLLHLPTVGMTINNDDPARIENWFYAVWAYNTGFYLPGQADDEAWGVGWANNPINPNYEPDRAPFLELTYADAADPQKWPYPEKVMGWAGHPIIKPNYRTADPDDVVGGYAQAWWTTEQNRVLVKPPLELFCDETNNCHPGERHENQFPDEPAGPCAEYDLRCWYHEPATWKPDCASTCGYRSPRYSVGDPEPPDGTSYPPNCGSSGLPSGALIIDDVPATVDPVRPCNRWWTNQGSFNLRFTAATDDGAYPSKIDFHQIGGGFGGHFWFAHTRNQHNLGETLRVDGEWRLNRELNGWARVLVHMPDHGAHTQQARYDVRLGDGTVKHRYLLQRTGQHRWVSLGAFQFRGTPSVTLSSFTRDGIGRDDVAWDAVAFQPLPGKPRHSVVALGDSYSSVRGASDPAGGDDYYHETDNNGGTAVQNDCHRSPHAWSRQVTLSGSASPVGARADAWDPNLDFHLVACAGAQTENLLPSGVSNAVGDPARGQLGEVSQLDRGFLDENTTLVMFSIGGNDARFGQVVANCVFNTELTHCFDAHLDNGARIGDEVPRLIAGPAEDSVVSVLREVHELAPNARIVLVGYPELFGDFNGTECELGIAPQEAQWMNEMSVLLRQHLGEAVQRARTEFGADAYLSDPIDDFQRKGLCDLEPAAIHGIVLDWTDGEVPFDAGDRVLVSNQSFHPNLLGASLYTQAVNATLRSMGL
jgi:hypothetical protein